MNKRIAVKGSFKADGARNFHGLSAVLERLVQIASKTCHGVHCLKFTGKEEGESGDQQDPRVWQTRHSSGEYPGCQGQPTRHCSSPSFDRFIMHCNPSMGRSMYFKFTLYDLICNHSSRHTLGCPNRTYNDCHHNGRP